MNNLPNLWRSSSSDPMRSMSRLQREIDRMFDDFNRELRFDIPSFSSLESLPICEMDETDSHYVLSFDMPGMAKDDVKIELKDNYLHVHGEKKEEHEEKNRRGRERSYRTYDRWIPLPAQTKMDKLEAQMVNGVLQVALPKSEVTNSKQIPISEGKTGFFSKLLEKKKEAA